jgi:GNAT superfamily N-acetyltransferase
MYLSAITEDNLNYFKLLLLPHVFELLTKGEDLTAIGLAEDGLACGAAAGYLDGDTFVLSSLFVADGYREKGGGTLLLQALKSAAASLKTVLWLRVDYTVSRQEHQGLAPFLERLGFEPVTGGLAIYGLKLGDVAKADFFAKSEGKAQSDLPFSEIPEIYIKMLDRGLVSTGTRPFEQPLDKAQLDRELSVGIVKDGKIEAYLVFDFSFDETLTLAYAFSGAEGPESAGRLISMLRSSFKRAAVKYPDDTQIIIYAATNITAALMERILMSCPRETLTKTYRYRLSAMDVEDA